MVEFLYSIDVWLFFFINHSMANPFFDILLPFLTDLNKQKIFLFVLAVWITYILWRGGRTGRVTIGLLVITVVFSDQFNSSIVKDLFGRIRPCRALDDVRLLVDCGGGLSFPSSHSVNNFAAAAVIGSFYPKQRIFWLIFAALVAFSRTYVGVHYPSDILAGALLGFSIGSVILFLWKFLETKYRNLHSVN